MGGFSGLLKWKLGAAMSDGREEREEEKKRRELEEWEKREDRMERGREDEGAPERGGS